MKKAACILALTIMAACCLIIYGASKDTVLKGEIVQLGAEILNVQRTNLQTESVKASEQEAVSSTDDKQEYEKEKQLLNQNGAYAFSTLTEKEKGLYIDILSALMKFEDTIDLATDSTQEIDKAFQCVLIDHPDIFYVDGYKYTKYSVGDKINRITFSGNYTCSMQEAMKRKNIIEDAADEILAGISKDASDYEKVKYVYETIINTTDYDLNVSDNQNICSVFLEHKSVCQGYAKATQYLLMRLDVPATLVVGTVKNGEGHAWNLVMIDDSYYYVDTTWGDAYYLLTHQQMQDANQKTPSINYDYLCVTTQQIAETHTIDSVVPMPVCDSLAANYYVMEGAYFTSYDEEKLNLLFQKARSQEKEAVTLKCSDHTVYETIMQELIEKQKVFHFVPELDGTVAYTNCEEQNSISFWM